MGMKSSMYSLMLMSVMMGMGGQGSPRGFSAPQRYKRQPPLSPEDEALIIDERKTKFISDLNKHNEERRINFPKFKEHIVHGLGIVAYSPKNALRDMNALMRQNNLQIQSTDPLA